MRQLESEYDEQLSGGLRPAILIALASAGLKEYPSTKGDEQYSYGELKEMIIRSMYSRRDSVDHPDGCRLV